MKNLMIIFTSMFLISCNSNNTKLRNGVSLTEALNPYNNGFENHLYPNGYDVFFDDLVKSILLMRENKLTSFDTTLSRGSQKIVNFKTNIKFWNSDVVLFKSDDGSFLMVENNIVRINTHFLESRSDLKGLFRVSLMNEAFNVLLADGKSRTIESNIKEEFLSDFVMSTCSDESIYLNPWFTLVSGRISPAINSGEYNSMSLNELYHAHIANPAGYVQAMREYGIILKNVTGKTSEELVEIEQNQLSFLSISCKQNEECYGRGMVSFWSDLLTPKQKLEFKSQCKQKFEDELTNYW